MLKKIINLFNFKHAKSILKQNKNDETEILDAEPTLKKNLKYFLEIFKSQNKVKITGFVVLLLFSLTLVISLISGKNVALIGIKKILNGVGIYTNEVDSIEINSELYNDAGSWNINKSAKWTSSNTAEVTFDVNSIRKTNGNKKDIILVLDTSDSMSGDKINKVINNTKELINEVLSNSGNRIAIIKFDTTSTILSPFTNKKDNLIKKLNEIEVKGCTNYNAALKNVDIVMNGYVKEKGKDIVTLFLTDGYPNEETPNQLGAYEVLKDKYPYMRINGVQYELGENIIKEIKEISDEQWNANQKTLNNILFEAAVSPLRYEKYIVSDYISEDFKVNSVSDIEVSMGKVELTEENNVQKITWNLGKRAYATGSNAKMTIKLSLKEEKTIETLTPTNKKESVNYKLEDEIEKTVNSSDTPVLKNMYSVIYDANTPDECKIDTIPSEKYGVYKAVTKKTNKLSCDGYQFKGWEIDEEDDKDIKKINNDMFVMPSHDVTIRATWTKQSITKEMAGTVHEKTTLYKVLQKEAEKGTYARKYTGEHQDSMDKSKSNKNIYYYHAYNDDEANAILDKNNVIFAGQCWQMIRTTDTGGVKMLYNGEVEDDKCLSTRGNHVGYVSGTEQSMDTTYYYGTSYKYDTATKSFSLSGTISTGTIKTGQYTCKNTSQAGTCTTLYYVDRLYSGTTYYILSLDSNSAYSQFGTLQFNYNDYSPASLGYMYNTTYHTKSRSYKKDEELDFDSLFDTNYWYADNVTYDSTTDTYSLDNPYQVSSTSDYSKLVGKYTFLNSNKTKTSSSIYYVVGGKEKTIYYKELSKGQTTVTDTYTYGDGYIDNGDGTYTIKNPTTVEFKDYLDSVANMKEKYVCKNAINNACSDLWYTVSYNNFINLNHVSIKDNFTYGNNFTYENGKYKLKDTKKINDVDLYKDNTLINNYHYTCWNTTGECSTLSYIYNYYADEGKKYYIDLVNGNSIEDALTEMLSANDVNTYNSVIKSGIDAWFEHNILEYSNYLEDTVFCNNRSIYDKGGFNSDGGDIMSSGNSIKSSLKFQGYGYYYREWFDNFNCQNITDKFSTDNEKARLKYKVGLLSMTEEYLSGLVTLLESTNIQSYWLITPSIFYTTNGIYPSGNVVYPYREFQTISDEYGVRPAVSLLPGTEYIIGEGSMQNPYIIDMKKEN